MYLDNHVARQQIRIMSISFKETPIKPQSISYCLITSWPFGSDQVKLLPIVTGK